MAGISEKDYIAELIFCINQSDVIKARALIQFFMEVDAKTQNRALYEFSKSPDAIAFSVLDYLLDLQGGENRIKGKVYDLISEIAYGNPRLILEQIERKASRNRVSYINIAGDLKMAEAIPVLMDALETSNDIKETRALISALGAIRAEACVPKLIRFLALDNPVIKSATISALSGIGNAEAIEHLTRALTGESCADKSIIDSLSGIQSRDSLEKLSGFLASEHADIRSLVVDGLVKIGSKAVPSLIEKLTSDDTDLKIHALTILGNIGDKSAAPAIQKLLFSKPENSNVRFAAYEALGRLPSSKSAISLAGGLEDPDEQVRLAAATAIDRNLTKVLIAGLRNLISARDEDSKRIVATFIDSESDNVFDAFVDWDIFSDLATEYLSEQADPDTQNHFLVMLKAKGKTHLIEKIKKEFKVEAEDGKLLIYAVDDSNMMLKLYSKKFHALGYKTVVFQYPVEALKALKTKKPDILVTDLNMPEINGLQLVATIREAYDMRELPIIMITTQSDLMSELKHTSPNHVTDDIVAQAGVNQMLNKPFSDEELASAIKRVTQPRSTNA